jgi:hypothetical protein
MFFFALHIPPWRIPPPTGQVCEFNPKRRLRTIAFFLQKHNYFKPARVVPGMVADLDQMLDMCLKFI